MEYFKVSKKRGRGKEKDRKKLKENKKKKTGIEEQNTEKGMEKQREKHWVSKTA